MHQQIYPNICRSHAQQRFGKTAIRIAQYHRNTVILLHEPTGTASRRYEQLCPVCHLWQCFTAIFFIACQRRHDDIVTLDGGIHALSAQEYQFAGGSSFLGICRHQGRSLQWQAWHLITVVTGGYRSGSAPGKQTQHVSSAHPPGQAGHYRLGHLLDSSTPCQIIDLWVYLQVERPAPHMQVSPQPEGRRPQAYRGLCRLLLAAAIWPVRLQGVAHAMDIHRQQQAVRAYPIACRDGPFMLVIEYLLCRIAQIARQLCSRVRHRCLDQRALFDLIGHMPQQPRHLHGIGRLGHFRLHLL